MSTRDLINAIAAGDAIEIENAFNSVMAEKVSARIDDMRIDVAQNLFAEQAEEFEEETELNLEDYSLEEIEDFMMSEDFEQLDELSVHKMLKYYDAAKKDRSKLNAKWSAGTATQKEKNRVIGHEEGEERAANKIKQKTGKYPEKLNVLQKARYAVTKEETELNLEDYSLEEFVLSEAKDKIPKGAAEFGYNVDAMKHDLKTKGKLKKDYHIRIKLKNSYVGTTDRLFTGHYSPEEALAAAHKKYGKNIEKIGEPKQETRWGGVSTVYLNPAPHMADILASAGIHPKDLDDLARLSNKPMNRASAAASKRARDIEKGDAKDKKDWAAYHKRRLKEEEELTLEDYSLDELEDFMMSEDFEQLDELSKDTLKSYIDKTKDPERKGNLANIVDKQGRKGMKSPEFKKRLAHQQKAVDKWWNPDYGFKGTKDE